MEQTVSFHSQVHKITFFLLSKVLTDTIKEELCEQLCLPAVVMGSAGGSLQGSKADSRSSAVLLFPKHLCQKEHRRDFKNIGVKVFAAHGPLLKHLCQFCLLVSCCSDLLLPPDNEAETRLLSDRKRS